MDDTLIRTPHNYRKIQHESEKIGFFMSSDLQTGCLLRTLISSKSGGIFLELGTGTGLSLSWIADSMDKESTLISIDISEEFTDIARSFFVDDHRVTIICQDGEQWIQENQARKFDLIFADAWPGKYTLFNEALNMLKIGGIYLIDDMSPQPNWPAGHQDNVDRLINELDSRNDIRLTKMNWSTGLIIVIKIK